MPHIFLLYLEIISIFHVYTKIKSRVLMSPIVVSFCTEGLYEEEIKDLILSCKTLDLKHSFENIKSLGSWEKNCCYKPRFILKKLRYYKKPLLWVDADAVVIKKPLIKKDFLKHDFGFFLNHDEKNNIKSIRAGTIFINYTKKSMDFLKAWDEECQKQLNDPRKTSEVWDEKCLFQLVLQKIYKITFFELPKGYCKIFDKYIDRINNEDIYILQFQAPRHYKNFINKNLAAPLFLKDLPPMELKKMRFEK